MEKMIGLGRSAAVRAGALVGGLTAAGGAMAAEFDVTSVTTVITAVGASVALIGAAVLAVKIGAKAWKWLSAAA